MLLMSLSFLIMFSLSMVMFILSLTISKKNKSQEKLSPFECGFDLMFNLRLPFSMKFFLIAIIFLIFDIEITFILPMVFCIHLSLILSWMKSMILFMVILIWGLFHEWFLGSLNWKK